jgi:hypothetical protein
MMPVVEWSDVFVSYSRKDGALVRRLDDGVDVARRDGAALVQALGQRGACGWAATSS